MCSLTPSQQPYTLAGSPACKAASPSAASECPLTVCGKVQLEGVQLVEVQRNLLERQKQHFTSLEGAASTSSVVMAWRPCFCGQQSRHSQARCLRHPQHSRCQRRCRPTRGCDRRSAGRRVPCGALAALHLPADIFGGCGMGRGVALAMQEETALAHMLSYARTTPCACRGTRGASAQPSVRTLASDA